MLRLPLRKEKNRKSMKIGEKNKKIIESNED